LARRAEDPARRFWRHVRRDPSGCWIWTGALATEDGEPTYGIFNRGGGVLVGAHCFAWELAHAGIRQRGFVVRHTCDVPACVNPRHLVIGTHKENTADMDARGRRRSNPVRGERHHASKLTIETVREARMLYNLKALGWSIKTLAEKYGVSQTSMASAIYGRTWRDV